MQTEVTRLLGIEYPIIQGGMAWVAEYHLAAGVSEAGGLVRRLGKRSGTQGKRTDRQTIRCQHHADESLCRWSCKGDCRRRRKGCYHRCG